MVATKIERLKIQDDPYRGRCSLLRKKPGVQGRLSARPDVLEHNEVEINLADRKALCAMAGLSSSDFSISTALGRTGFLHVKP